MPATFDTATDHHRAGRLSEAEREYLQLLDLDANDVDTLRLLAALYVQTKRPLQAVGFFERALSVNPQDAEILNNLGVALHDAGRFNDAIARYEQSTALNFPPAKQNLARASYDRGNTLLAEGSDDEATVWYERALELDPQHFRAMNNLAGLNRRKGRLDEARALYEKALQLKPDYVEARINLGNALRDAGDANGAAACYRQVLNAKPNSADALHNLGVLYQDSREIKQALSHFSDALKHNPDSDIIKSTKGFAHLALGQFEQGWALNEAGLGNKCLRGPMLFPAPIWDGREFTGKRLLIWCEQGLGDNIQFVRYAEHCKQRGGTVIVLAPPHLARLFKSVPGVEEVKLQATPDDFDFHVPMMSLPNIFGTRLNSIPAKIPYVSVDQASREKWEAKIPKSSGRKIGLVWGGSSRETITDAWLLDRRRSISLELLKPLLETPNTRFYSLQLGKPAVQLDEFGLRDLIADLTPGIEDFMDTAALVENLDLVITVDTSAAHLAGAMGKPVWILSRFDACWRWLQNREDSPWYPTARIFGQPKAGDWDDVVKKVKECLSL